jgi:hypothetical protein
MRVTATPLGAALLLGGVSIKPSPFSISSQEDNQALTVMGALCFRMGDLLVRVSSWCRALATEDNASIDGFKLSA